MLKKKDDFPNIIKQFQLEFSIENQKSHDRCIEELSKISMKYNSDNHDLAIHDFIKIYSKEIKLLSEAATLIFIETLKIRKSVSLSPENKNEIKNYIKNFLDNRCMDYRSNLERYSASIGKNEKYKSGKVYWIDRELEGQIGLASERLDVEIEKYNCNPLDFYSQNKDRFKFEALKYLATSGISGAIGFALGKFL